MWNESDYDDDDTHAAVVVYNDIISLTVKFWVYLFVLIPSIICSLISLGHVIFNRALRIALHNHVIAVVLFIGLFNTVTIYPWMLFFFRHQGVWYRSAIFCTIWAFIDWGLYFTQTILFAWATIERHILIFHSNWLATKRKRFLLHYLPLLLLLIYCLTFYITVSFFPSCQNYFDDRYMICTAFCFTDTYGLYMWDAVVHQVLPNVIIVVCSTGLLIRVLYRKYPARRLLYSRKYRKMTIQLLSFSLLYLLFDFPLSLMNLMYLCGLSPDMGRAFYEYLLFLNYLLIPMLPFACIISTPRLKLKVKAFIS